MSRWYSHGWNTTTSLRMILTFFPRVPRSLVPPIGVVTTAICLASMKRERKAAGRTCAASRRAEGPGKLPLRWFLRHGSPPRGAAASVVSGNGR